MDLCCGEALIATSGRSRAALAPEHVRGPGSAIPVFFPQCSPVRSGRTGQSCWRLSVVAGYLLDMVASWKGTPSNFALSPPIRRVTALAKTASAAPLGSRVSAARWADTVSRRPR